MCRWRLSDSRLVPEGGPCGEPVRATEFPLHRSGVISFAHVCQDGTLWQLPCIVHRLRCPSTPSEDLDPDHPSSCSPCGRPCTRALCGDSPRAGSLLPRRRRPPSRIRRPLRACPSRSHCLLPLVAHAAPAAPVAPAALAAVPAAARAPLAGKLCLLVSGGCVPCCVCVLSSFVSSIEWAHGCLWGRSSPVEVNAPEGLVCRL